MRCCDYSHSYGGVVGVALAVMMIWISDYMGKYVLLTDPYDLHRMSSLYVISIALIYADANSLSWFVGFAAENSSTCKL